MIPLPYTRHTFVHPGIMVSKDMLDQLRANVAGKKEPVKKQPTCLGICTEKCTEKGAGATHRAPASASSSIRTAVSKSALLT